MPGSGDSLTVAPVLMTHALSTYTVRNRQWSTWYNGPVANIVAYDATNVDWNTVGPLAMRAAQQTKLSPAPVLGYVNRQTGQYVQLLGPHWVLDHRMQNSESTNPGVYVDEDHTDDVYALLPGGDLMYVQVITEARVYLPTEYSLGRSAPPTYKDRHTARKMTDSDVQDFDFAKERYNRGDHHTEAGRVWGDTVWAGLGRGELSYDHKGMGLARLLEDVTRSRSTLLPLPGSLVKFQDPDQLSREHAVHKQRVAAEAQDALAFSRANAKRSREWSKRQARRKRAQRTDRIFDKVVGAFKGGAVGLVLWFILAVTVGLVAGLGVVVVIIAAVVGAALE